MRHSGTRRSSTGCSSTKRAVRRSSRARKPMRSSRAGRRSSICSASGGNRSCSTIDRMAEPIHFGLEVACEAPPDVLRRSRGFGLLSNQASVDANFRHAADVLHRRFPGALKALFGPQHGLWSGQQDNMIETGHGTDARLGLPVHSLYSETRRPTPQMLDGLDLLVVDLQDVGTRVYTYVWTLTHCLEACAEKGIPV